MFCLFKLLFLSLEIKCTKVLHFELACVEFSKILTESQRQTNITLCLLHGGDAGAQIQGPDTRAVLLLPSSFDPLTTFISAA
jgi:hypothetical protein